MEGKGKGGEAEGKGRRRMNREFLPPGISWAGVWVWLFWGKWEFSVVEKTGMGREGGGTEWNGSAG